MASFPQISKTMNSRGVSEVLNHLGRNPSGRLKPLRPDLEDRNFDQEEEKRPASNHSSILSRQASEPIEKQYIPDDDNMSVHSTASRRSESRISGPLNGLKNYPPSIKAADKRAERISSGLDGKAFLMDIDNKFDNQDKLINHLIEQINSMSVKVDSVNRNQKMIQDTERDARMKIESNFKMNSDESNFSLSELMSKISTMDEKLRRDDQIKNELRDRVMVAEGNQRELMTFMSQTKKQDEAELKQLRNMLQEIHSDDQVDKSKNNEKSAAMFQEVVRIGTEQEKVIENLTGLNANLEQQIATLDNKVSLLEQNSGNLQQKGEVSNNMMGELAEKIEKRLHNVEDVIHMVNSEQRNEKDKLSHHEITALKNNDEFRNMLGHLQKDYGTKLEVRMTELVSRLLNEQDERMKNVDDLKYTIDTKEKMINEKSKYEREEMRNRYSAMDAITKAEFQRHNEAIAGIQNNLEAQMRTISSWVKQEELNRTQLEVNMRMEVSKITEQLRSEQEGFQRQQVQINEKITDMIRMETDARERSEDEKKSLIQNLIRGVTEEVVGIKEDTDNEIRKLTQEVKDVANDNAERSHFLSRYVDDEIYKVSEKVAKPIDNLKMLSTRLTEQFKKHLINHENIKKDIYKRFDFLEKHMPVYRSELYKLIEKSEGRLLIKMKELKENLDNNLMSNFKVFDDRMDQFSELVDK
jgi:tetrahydromethanopterin S-methyltransferase subunit G